MSISKLTTRPSDEGTAVYSFSIDDETDSDVTPNDGCTWSLYDEVGNVVNNRSDVAITEAATMNIVMSGDDLSYADGSKRVLVIKGTYDSTNGSNLPFKHQVEFAIDDIVGV